MRDPDYLAQTAEPTTKEGRRQWIEARRDEARTEGVTHARLSWDAHLNLILFLMRARRGFSLPLSANEDHAG
jgi:hypothetical protein